MATPIRIVAEIEGAEHLFCTVAGDAGSSTHGRTIVGALDYDGLTVGERADIKNGRIEGESLTLQIVSTPDIDYEFSRSAKLLTFLSSSVTSTGATTFNVRSNSLLVDNRYVHIGTECVQIADTTTNAVTVVRARRGTNAQIFLRDDGADATEIPIWDKVHAWQGRRITLTAYEFGSFTVAMRGVIAQAPYLSSDGTSWLVDVDHIASIMEQDVGVPSSVTAGIRGIRFGRSSAFGVSVGLIGAQVHYSLTGFYETEQEALTAVNTLLDTVTITGVDDLWFADGAVHLRVAGADVDQPAVRIGSSVFDDQAARSNAVVARWFVETAGQRSTIPVTLGTPLLASTVYATPVAFGFPRSMIHVYGAAARSVRLMYSYPFENNAGVDAEIALNADLGIGNGASIILSGGSLPEPLRLTVNSLPGDLVYGFDPAVDDLDGYCQRNGLDAVILDEFTEVRAQQALGIGSLYNFLSAVTAAAPYANDGTIPYITASDLDTSQTAIESRLSASGDDAFNSRNYNISEPASFADVVAAEMQLLGLMFTTTSAGKLALRTFDVLNATTPYTLTLDADTIVTPHGDAGAWPGWITERDGVVSVVHMVAGKNVAVATPLRTRRGPTGRYAYSWLNVQDPAVHVYRDVASLSAYKSKGVDTLEIQPEVNSTYDLTSAQAIEVGSRIVRFFGQPYETITVKARRTAETIAARLGDVVMLTSDLIPNSGNGTRGVSNRRGRIVGRSVPFDPAESATVEFTIIMHTQSGSGTDGANNIAGYAGSAVITGAANIAANRWTCTVTQSFYAPDNGDDTDFFAVGDYVIAIQDDDATPNTQTGTVESKTATTIVVAFDGVAPWGGAFSGAYTLDFADVSVGMTDLQDDYCYTGDATLLLSNGNPARIFA